MRVSLIKNDQIRTMVLPNQILGSYWVVDYDKNGSEYNLISIEANSGEWKLISNKDTYCVDGENSVPLVSLKTGVFYTIKNTIDNSISYIVCSPYFEELYSYNVEKVIDQGINVSSDQSSMISSDLLQTTKFTIKRENDLVYLYTTNDSSVYINNFKAKEKHELKIGDTIFAMGVKIIISKFKKEYYIYANNINNSIKVTGLMQQNIEAKSIEVSDEEEIEMDFYTEDSYFHKTPRFISLINEKEIKIDAPPEKENQDGHSLLMTIGPMITMSMTSLVTAYVAVNNVLSKQTTWKNAMPSLVIAGTMFASMLIWPLINKKIEKRRKKEYEKKRQEKYSQYIDTKRVKIAEELKNQHAILTNNYPSVLECEKIIINKYANLWQRRIEDQDFALVNLGLGNYEMKINIKYPEEHFSMVEDNLKQELERLGSEPKTLNGVPVVYSLIENNISAIIGKTNITSEYFNRILLQLFTFHSYDDLKIVILTDKKNEYNWKIWKDVPHLWSNNKKSRFYASDINEYKEVCYNLERIYSVRKETKTTQKTEAIKPIYIIITDCFKSIRDFDLISSISQDKENYGFNLLILDNKVTNLPDQCKSFMKINEKNGELFTNVSTNQTQIFNIDLLSKIDIEACITKLSNIPIETTTKDEGQLPNRLGFLEMYDVGKVEQLNSLNRWKRNNPILNLQAPVGIGKSGEKISIDLHEKYHGPHGLIAGMTGSGKSEFIITYILSMAVNYHPEEVQFILIDYKGGGLAGAFENSMTGIKLPHLVGTITNLDANEIKRSLASIESELKRRQRAFNQAREISGESTIDIYKYQKMYREGIMKEPVSHLFIISDEFAELKSQQPEFMDQLISTARIGRSLGVHLILATQKPSGVVDPQIWSNTRFRVALRVQEKSDSMEIIKSPEAAFLQQTGRFYFQVGYNEVFTLGQAAWAGAQYFPAEKVKKTIDTTINVIDNIGYVVKTIETKHKQEQVKASGEELSSIVSYLATTAKTQGIATNPLWLEKLSEFISVDALINKYKIEDNPNYLEPIVGEYDIPNEQRQEILTVPFTKEGNVLLYGASGSGKENFITTMIYSSSLFKKSEDVNYYIIDFGSGALKTLSKIPLIGDILTVEKDEKIANLFKMISQMIEERKKLFSEFGGDYKSYVSNNRQIAQIVVIINNYEAYQETYSDFDDTIVNITRECTKYGIYFLISLNTPNGIRFKLKQNFQQSFVLQQNSEDDYSAILGTVSKTYPSKFYGRGIIKRDKTFEFQTALITDRNKINKFIEEKFSDYEGKKAKQVPMLPEVVEYESVMNEFGNDKELIVGIKKEDLSVIKIPFNKSVANIITALDIQTTCNLTSSLINQTVLLNDSSLLVINAEEYKVDGKYSNSFQYIDNKFDDIFEKLNNFLSEQQKAYIENNYDKKIFESKKPIQCIIIGIESFKNKLNNDNKLKFQELFNNSKDIGIINYILVDSIDKFKKVEFETWYKTFVNSMDGIWIGNGFNDQFTIKSNQKLKQMKEEISDDYCFVVKKGKPFFVKYLNNFYKN